MKRVLRSVIDIQDVSQDHLALNYRYLKASGLTADRGDDIKILDYIHTFFEARLELPDLNTVRDHFNSEFGPDLEVLERLKEVKAAPPYVRSNFAHLVQQLLENRNKIKLKAVLTECSHILDTGVEFKDSKGQKTRKQGLKDTVAHFQEHATDLVNPEYTAKTHGSVREDGEEVWKDYQEAKNNPGGSFGCLSGLSLLDNATRGVRPGSLWIHAAFAGELKSTTALNACYNLATRYHVNSVYWSLEMPYEHCRLCLYAIHSANPKWAPLGYRPLDYLNIRDGLLSNTDEEFLKRVIEDFCNHPEYCDIDILCPSRDMTVREMRMETELIHKAKPIRLVVLDHSLLIKPDGRFNNDRLAMNSVVRDAKKMAMHFNNGEKTVVLLLQQINRQGKDDADKNEGRYKMSALAEVNEAERSGDVVSYTYLNQDHRDRGTALFGTLKIRAGRIVAPGLIGVNFSALKLYNFNQYNAVGLGVDDQNDVFDQMEI